MTPGTVMHPHEIVTAFLNGDTLAGLSAAAEEAVRAEIRALHSLTSFAGTALTDTGAMLSESGYDRMSGNARAHWERWYLLGYAHGAIEATLAHEHAINRTSIYALLCTTGVEGPT